MVIINLLILSLLSLVIQAEDLYKILGVSDEAGEHEIKKAFRKLSVQYHPDKNPGNKEAHQKYLEVSRAYEILTDPEKKQIYDLFGEEGLNDHLNSWRNKQKGPNAQADIRVTLEDLYNGAEKEFTMQKKIICKKCKGTGSKDGTLKVCKSCGGRGVRMQNVNMGIGFNVQMQVPCDRCGGKGRTSSGNCPGCKGSQVVGQQKNLKIDIERGMQNGQNIVFKGESEQHPDYMPGDLIFTIVQERHSFFTRKGDDLHMDMRISLKEAILGFKKSIRHLDNHYVEIESSSVIQPFQVKTIREEGMPIHTLPSSKGDLHVRFIVELPKKLSENDQKLLKKIFDSK